MLTHLPPHPVVPAEASHLTRGEGGRAEVRPPPPPQMGALVTRPHPALRMVALVASILEEMVATPMPPLLRMEVVGMLTHPARRMAAPAEVGPPSAVMAVTVAMQMRVRRQAGASATPTHPAPRMAAPAEMDFSA